MPRRSRAGTTSTAARSSSRATDRWPSKTPLGATPSLRFIRRAAPSADASGAIKPSSSPRLKTSRTIILTSWFFTGWTAVTPTALQQEAFNFYQPQQGPFTQTNDALTGFGRLDYNFTQNQRVSLSYHYSKNNRQQRCLDRGTPSHRRPVAYKATTATEGDRTNTVVGQWTGILSSRFVIENAWPVLARKSPRASPTRRLRASVMPLPPPARALPAHDA